MPSEVVKRQNAIATLRWAMMEAVAQCHHIHRMEPDTAKLVVEEIMGTVLSEKYRWALGRIYPKVDDGD